MKSKKLQSLGGIASILQALIYISAFIVYGGVLTYPSANASTQENLQFLTDNYLTLSILNLIIYVLFGILLIPLVMSIHQRLKNNTPIISKVASVLGYVWVGLVIASGMISNIGLTSVIEMGADNPEKAMIVWSSINIVTEGLGGGNEIVGGLWVLLISIAALSGKVFSKGLNFLGLLVGLAGVLTIYPLELFTEIFGLGQILWFL